MTKLKTKATSKPLQRGKQYPGVHGKVVDFIDHGWGEGALYIHVRFMDKTEVCWQLAAHLTIKEADLSDWKRGEFDHSRTSSPMKLVRSRSNGKCAKGDDSYPECRGALRKGSA